VTTSPVSPAVAGDIEQSGRNLTIAAGGTDSSGTVTITAVDNDAYAPDKQVTVSGAADNAQGIAGDPEDVTLIIEEGEAQPSVSFAAARYEAREGFVPAGLAVWLSGPLSSPVTIPLVATPGGGATPPGEDGADYEGVPESLTFEAGSTRAIFSVTAINDDIDDDGEQVSLRFGDLPDEVLSGKTAGAIVALEDNDKRGLILGPEQLRFMEGATGAYEMRLASEPASDVTVRIAYAPDTGLQVSPERLVFTAADWFTPQRVAVQAGHDEDADDEAASFTHTVSGGDYGALEPVAFPVTVIDDDPRWVVTLSAAPAAVAEGAGATAIAVAGTLNEAREEDTRVNLHALPGADTERGDFDAAPLSFVIPAGETAAEASMTLTPADNRVVEGAKQVALMGAAEQAAVTAAQITITDDDAPSWTLGLTPASIPEGSSAALTASTGGVSYGTDQALALTFSGTASIGTDYSVTSGGSALAGPPYALVLSAGSSSAEARITAVSDSVSDGGETVAVAMRHGGTGAGPVTLTITEGVCARTKEVRDALVLAAGAADCADVTPAALAAIATLDFSGGPVTSVTLKSGDLAGLSGLKTLIFRGVALSSVPSDIFADLRALELLNLKTTGLTSLPDGVFSGLSRLSRLTLENNALGSLNANVFSGLSGLTDLNLRKTSLASLPDGVFAGLSKLTILNLRGNRITQLSGDVFRELTALETLNLINNRLSAIPDGLFEGLTQLASVRLEGNAGSPFSLVMSVEKTGEDGVRAVLPTGAPFDIKVALSVSGNGTLEGEDHGVAIATGQTHSRTLAVSRKAGGSGPVTATLAELPKLPNTNHQGYALAKSASLPLTVLEGYVSASLSVADPPDVKEGPDATVVFTVTLAPAVDRVVTATYTTSDGTAKSGEDYEAVNGTLTFKANETSKTVTVKVLDDSVDESRETFRLLLLKAAGADIADGDGEVAIVNADPLPRAWLARFGGVVAGHVAGGIGERLTQPEGGGHARFSGLAPLAGEDLPGAHTEAQLEHFGFPSAVHTRGQAGSLAGSGPGSYWPAARRFGPGVRFGPHPFSGMPYGDAARRGQQNAPMGTSQGPAARDLLPGGAFTAALGRDEENAPARFTLWGRAMATRFAGSGDGLRLDGEAATYLLGADRSFGRWLAGVALAQSRGAGGYDAPSGERGEMKSHLTSVHPYARYAASERLTAWGALGYGQGELTLARQGAGSWNADTSMTMAAAGVRGTIKPAAYTGGFELAVRSDALWTSIASGAAGNAGGRLAASRGGASRLRLILEGARASTAAGGRSLAPNVELGLRHDAGDAETGTGLELGAGVRYRDAAMGLSIEVKARSFIAHQNEAYREWGASAAVRFDPATPGRGLMLTLKPSWGHAASGAERLWTQQGMLGRSAYGGLDPDGRMDAEVSYAANGPKGLGMQTPYAAWALENAGSRTIRVGWRWAMGQNGNLDIEGTRRKIPNGQDTENGISLRASFRW
ncbi:MAG: leucine-rich repeat protein, partial [Gammaproteobacteria bacterium]|nr:leucine-rich repeat protein [Gammaproteobacteria bacterium]